MGVVDDLQGARLVDADTVSKSELIGMVNEQTEAIKDLKVENRKVIHTLLAMVKRFNDLELVDGRVVVPMAAIEEVTFGMRLNSTPNAANTALELEVVDGPDRTLPPGRHGIIGSPAALIYTKKDGTREVH